jgi:hypothetical protein
VSHRDPKFTVRCRLTCLGGSEHGECECRHPAECGLADDPHFEQARANAKARMMRYLLNGLGES